MKIQRNADNQGQGELPLFGSPREFSDNGNGASEPMYVEERFEEADLFPIRAMALSCQTLPEALNVIFDAYHPQEPAWTAKSEGTFSRERI